MLFLHRNIKFYKNVGNQSNPEFIEDESFEIPYLGLNVSPDIYTSNNTIGLVAGISTGGMYFLSLEGNIQGDINNDLIVNIFDVIILIEYILFNEGNDMQFVTLDVNNDDIVNILDVIQLVELILIF